MFLQQKIKKGVEVLKEYLLEDSFLKTRFIVRTSDYPKLMATKQRITRQIQKLEGEQIAKQKKREEKKCYEDGGRKCIREGCVGLCVIQKKGNGKTVILPNIY